MRKALRQATRTRRGRPWVWAILVILVNLGLWTSIVLVADQRLMELELRMEGKLQDEQTWRTELIAAQSELGSELGVEVAELRSELTELRGEVSADEGDLRGALDDLEALRRRVARIESMVAAMWRAPSN